jgi:hypothetical protein
MRIDSSLSFGKPHYDGFVPGAYHGIPGLLFHMYDQSDLRLKTVDAEDNRTLDKIVVGVHRAIAAC